MAHGHFAGKYSRAEDSFIIKNFGKLSLQQVADTMSKQFKRKLNRNMVWSRYLLLKKQQDVEKNIRQRLKNKGGVDVIRVQGDGRTQQAITLHTNTIRTPEELLALANVDLEVWEVKDYVVNKWDSFARAGSKEVEDKNGKRDFVSVELFQVKINLQKRKAHQRDWQQLRNELIGDLKKHSPTYKPIARADRPGQKMLAVLGIPDHHFGKLCWAEETGFQSYDLKIAEQMFNAAADDLLSQLKAFPVAFILFPVGNDMLHVDNKDNTTTAGTQQDVDGRWQKAFRVAKRCVVRAIEEARKLAPVKVMVVPGNHDTQRIFYLGDVLESHFRLCPDVEVDNGPTRTKFCPYGKSLLGFTHGDSLSEADLPMIMANTVPHLFANAVHKEWFLGHKHTRKHSTITTKNQKPDLHVHVDQGVHIRISPALCPPDAWHASEGYIGGPQASEAYLYDFDKGYAGHLVHNPIV